MDKTCIFTASDLSKKVIMDLFLSANDISVFFMDLLCIDEESMKSGGIFFHVDLTKKL